MDRWLLRFNQTKSSAPRLLDYRNAERLKPLSQPCQRFVDIVVTG